jgi:hypothetical protein
MLSAPRKKWHKALLSFDENKATVLQQLNYTRRLGEPSAWAMADLAGYDMKRLHTPFWF